MKRNSRVEMPLVFIAVALLLVLVAFGTAFPDSDAGEILETVSFGLLP